MKKFLLLSFCALSMSSHAGVRLDFTMYEKLSERFPQGIRIATRAKTISNVIFRDDQLSFFYRLPTGSKNKLSKLLTYANEHKIKIEINFTEIKYTEPKVEPLPNIQIVLSLNAVQSEDELMDIVEGVNAIFLRN